MVMKELEKVLAEQITNMEANDLPECISEMKEVYQEVYLDRTEKDNSK